MSWARLANRPNNGSYTPKKRNQTIKTIHNNNKTNNNDPVPIVQVTSSKNKHNDIHTVILDSGAFIGRTSFFNNFQSSTKYYMTPAVNNEVRDKQSRQFMQNFPYKIEIKKPDPDSMKYVSRFIQKHPNLKSLSKVDRQVIALAHTLELQFNGKKYIRNIDDILKNRKYNPNKDTIKKAMSESGGVKVKRSKSGRIHTVLKPMDDTGVRLSVMKKIVPFNFDDFMTMNQQQYGDKYGTPTSMDTLHVPSPIHKPEEKEKEINDNEGNKDLNKKDKDNKDEGKENDNDNNNDGNKIEKETEKVKDTKGEKKNINDKNNNNKKTDKIQTKKIVNNDKDKDKDKDNKDTKTSSPLLSKAQKRRRRKKKQPQKSKSLQNEITTNPLTGLINDRHSIHENEEMDINDQLDVNELDLTDTKSEIDKMIEHDLNTTFSETASLISSMSETNLRQMQQYQEMNARLSNNNSAPYNIQEQQQSISPQKSSTSITFGTLFTGKAGSIFNNPIQPLSEQNPIEISTSTTNITSPSINDINNIQNMGNLHVNSLKNANDAWNGDWLTPENYKPVAKNTNKKKSKVKNVNNSTNITSSIATITIDLAMQRCMIEMGLRVMTTSHSRQIGGGQQHHNNNRNQRQNRHHNNHGHNQRHNNNNRHNQQYQHNNNDMNNMNMNMNINNNMNMMNNEPIQYIFRCYGCFQFEHDTTRIHCRWCGGQTYQRVAIYQDINGKQHYRYYYRDRFGYKYLEKHSLVPRGSQLIKNKGSNSNNHHNYQRNYKGQYGSKQRRRQKQRGYLGGQRNNNNGYNPNRRNNNSNNYGGGW